MSIIASLIVLSSTTSRQYNEIGKMPVIMEMSAILSMLMLTCGNTLTLVGDIRDSVTRHISDTCYVTDTDSG